MSLTDEQILQMFKPHMNRGRRESPEYLTPEFTLADLVGKTIASERKIANPRRYNPKVEGPNPQYFSIVEFKDGSILLTDDWGDGECDYTDFYLYTGEKILYNDELFRGNAIWRKSSVQ